MPPIPQRTQQIQMVREYGCVDCQTYHVREIEPELFGAHLHRQSKHGLRERPATVAEQFAMEMRREEGS